MHQAEAYYFILLIVWGYHARGMLEKPYLMSLLKRWRGHIVFGHSSVGVGIDLTVSCIDVTVHKTCRDTSLD